jgi:hypothetical protein
MCGGPFIAPPNKSSHWGVRDLDMSRLGAEHVQLTSLEPSLVTKPVRFWGLNQS